MEINKLAPNKKNPRKITDKRLEMLRASIVKYGDLSGFVYNTRTQQLISGHQRKRTIPENSQIVIEHEYKTPTKAKTVAEGYVLVDGEKFKYREVDADELWEAEALLAANKHGGEWDNDLLKNIITMPNFKIELAGFELPELKEFNIDFKVPTVESDEEYVKNTEQTEEQIPVESPNLNVTTQESEAEVIPEVKKSRFVDGMWTKIGHVTIVCGDSTDPIFVTNVLGDKKIDFLFTDPPYGIKASEFRQSDKQSPSQKTHTVVKPPIIGDDSIETARLSIEVIKSINPDSYVIFGANNFSHFLPLSPNWLVWDKRVNENNRDHNSDCELAFVKSRFKSVRIFRHLWKGMIKGSENGEKRVHPTQKPIALVEWCINEYAPDAKVVLDLFGGSGPTAVACQKMGKECFIFEKDPNYCEIIALRVEAHL